MKLARGFTARPCAQKHTAAGVFAVVLLLMATFAWADHEF